MSLDMTETEKIRAFEYNVLDQHHQGYAFYQYSDDIVIPYLLQVYGDIERYRDWFIRHGHDATNLSFLLHNRLHGLGHCFRWMIDKKGKGTKDISGNAYQQIHAMAADFLSWGTGYHMIAQEFVTWSRGIKTATLDEEKMTIAFMNPQEYEYKNIYKGQLAYAERMAQVYESYPHEEMEKEFSRWIQEIDLSKPPIFQHIKWQQGRHAASYPLLSLKMKEILLPELDETTDLQGYNLHQLRQFYALVFLNFHFIRWIEAVLDAHTENDELSFGSHPLELSQNQFEKLTSVMTGLALDVTRAIIADLTFDPSSFHTSVSIQPFIRSYSGSYYILPNLFAQVEPSRMVLGALNKGAKRNVYNTLINTIEKANLTLLYETTNQMKGCICYLEKQMKNNGRTINPDLLIIDPSDKFLIVADYKHFIGPITASEVNYKMKELEKGIMQVNKYKICLSQLPQIGSLGIKDYTIAGLLITHKLLPIPTPKENAVPIVDLASFIEEVKYSMLKSRSLRDLYKKINVYFLKESEMAFSDYESEIRVGDWLIKRTQYKISDQNKYKT